MSTPSEELALPASQPGPIAVPAPPSFGFTAFPAAPQASEPSLIWRTLNRHFKLLALATAICIALAYFAGQKYGKPTWQAEATLLCQAVSFTPQQLAVYQDPPNLTTLASMVCEPSIIEQLAREFDLGDSVDEFVTKNVKVNQPNGTQLIVIGVSTHNRDQAVPLLNRFCDLFGDFVVVHRKETILRKALTSAQQSCAVAKNEIERYKRQIADFEMQLARTGRLPEIDPDGTLAIRRGTLLDDINKSDNLLEELSTERAKIAAEIARIRRPVEQGAYPRSQLRDEEHKLELVSLRIRHNEEKIKTARDELRRLPIVLAQGKLFAEESKAKDAAEQIGRLKAALVTIGRPGGPPATGLLEGMDARELTVKSPARVGEKPLASTKRSIALYTFVGLMGCVFGLAMLFDHLTRPAASATPTASMPPPAPQRAPPAKGEPIRTSVVQVEHRNGRTEKVTIAQVESPRLSVRIDQWIKSGPDSVNGLPPLTMNPDGSYRESPPPVDREHEARHMAARIHQWLEKGSPPTE